MEVTTTLISSLLAVNIIDIAVRELRIRRDAKETIKAIEKISLSNEQFRIKVDYLHKEFGELTSLMLSNKLHYDQISDEMTSRIDLMQVRHNKENLLLQSEIKEMSKDLSVQVNTLKNELQATTKTIEELKRKSEYRTIPATELFGYDNLETQIKELTERVDSLLPKDKKSSNKRDSHFNIVPAEDLLKDATPIMDWANEKLHEDEPKKANKEPQLSFEEQKEQTFQKLSTSLNIPLEKITSVFEFLVKRVKQRRGELNTTTSNEPQVEQQPKRRGRPRKETQQVVEDAQSTETTSEVKSTATPTSKSKKKQPLFTTKEVHDEILRKLKIKWFTLRRKYGEEYYNRQYKKAYKRLYYYKFDAVSNPKQTSLTPTKENNTNYESIF